MDRNDEQISTHRQYHKEHFASIKQIESTASALVQRLSDHQKVDDDRFNGIEEMNRELREDVKEILRCLRGMK